MARQRVFDFCKPKRRPIITALDDSTREELLHGMAQIMIHFFKRAKEEEDDQGSQSQDNTGTLEQKGNCLCSAIIGETGSEK
jgi:hypothetical protein